MYTVKWTKRAGRHLDEQISYIASDNPQAAAKVLKHILQTLVQLQRFPFSGPETPDGLCRKISIPHLPYSCVARFF
jgi:plasmid stabilization system protein ParE